MVPHWWSGEWQDPNIPPMMTPSPAIRRVHSSLTRSRTTPTTDDTSKMIDDELLAKAAQFINMMSTPNNALALWVAATGLIAGAYLAAPLL